MNDHLAERQTHTQFHACANESIQNKRCKRSENIQSVANTQTYLCAYKHRCKVWLHTHAQAVIQAGMNVRITHTLSTCRHINIERINTLIIINTYYASKSSPCWIEACVYNYSVHSLQWWKKNASDLLALFLKNSHFLHFNFTFSLIDPIDSFQIIELWWLLTLYLLWGPCMESISIKLYFMCFILLESFKHSVICCGENSVYKGTYDSLPLLL